MIYNLKMFETTNIYSFDLKKIDVNAKEIKYIKAIRICNYYSYCFFNYFLTNGGSNLLDTSPKPMRIELF